MAHLHYADKFLKANNAEKCALFVINQTNKIRKKKKIIHPYLNKKVLIIKFENLVTSTEKELKKISKFLNTSVTSSSKKFIKNANCPRTINPKNKLPNDNRLMPIASAKRQKSKLFMSVEKQLMNGSGSDFRYP